MRAPGCPVPYRHVHIVKHVERLLHMIAREPSSCQIAVADMQDIHTRAVKPDLKPFRGRKYSLVGSIIFLIINAITKDTQFPEGQAEKHS